MKETETQLIIRIPSGTTLKIQKKEVANVKISYTAVSACYTLKKEPEKEICTKQIFSLTDKKVQFVNKDSSDPPETVTLDEIVKLEIRKQAGEEMIPFLKDNSKLTIRLNTGVETGTVVSHSESKMQFRSENGNIREIAESDILSTEIKDDTPKKKPEIVVSKKPTISACYALKTEPEKEICTRQLLLLTGDKAQFVKKD
ncbi:MAG: hypothetical protein K8R21_16065, partial [Leptospira sp.]|nr:hypothetical protein [Leptospira sp.]